MTAKKTIKDMGQFVGRDTGAGILHRQYRGVRRLRQLARSTVTLPVGRRKLQCIVQQVVNHLTQMLGVALHFDWWQCLAGELDLA